MPSFFSQNHQPIEAGLGNGYLYNPYAVFDANFAPTDWHAATIADYQDINSELFEGFKEDNLIHWDAPNTNGTAINNFNAFGAGRRLPNGTFENIKTGGYFWAYFTEVDKYHYWLVNNSALFAGAAISGNYGMSVRMVYDGAGTPTTVTDNDGNIYDVALVAGLRWTVLNWKCTTLDNGDQIPTETDNTNWANATTLKKCAYGNDPVNV